jgi:hypothetical protein
MTTLRLLLTLLGASFVAGSFTACVDTEPLAFVEKLEDSGSEGGVPQAVRAACRQCLTDASGPCRGALDFCDTLPKCRPLAECLMDDGCLSLPTLEERIMCGNPCLVELDIGAGTDPAVTGVLEVNACSLGACRSECFYESGAADSG